MRTIEIAPDDFEIPGVIVRRCHVRIEGTHLHADVEAGIVEGSMSHDDAASLITAQAQAILAEKHGEPFRLWITRANTKDFLP